MAGKGPPKIPTAILKARDSWKADGRDSEPVPEPGNLHLTLDLQGKALETWERLAPRLTWLTPVDSDLLSRYCKTAGQWHQCQHDLDCAVVFDQKTVLYNRSAKLSEILLRMEAQLGLSPSARAGIKVPDKPKMSDAKLRILRQA